MNAIAKGAYFDTIAPAADGPVAVPLRPASWLLLRVHPNREGKVMRAFARRGISGYVPMIPTTRTVTRTSWVGREVQRRHQVKVPLFPGLIMMPDDEALQQSWRDIDGTIGLLQIGPCLATLDAQRFADVLAIEAIGCTPRSKRERMFTTGQLIRVVDGPFASFAGRIERLDSRGRLSVLLDIFGRMTPLSLDEGQIVPASHPTDASTDRQQRIPLRRRPPRLMAKGC